MYNTLIFSVFDRAKVSFGVDSPQQIQQQAHLHVVANNIYNLDASKTPIPYGPLDRRMVIVIPVHINCSALMKIYILGNKCSKHSMWYLWKRIVRVCGTFWLC